MNNKSIYSNIYEAKTHDLIPLLHNGKSIESRYSPVIEAQRIINNIKTDSRFYVVIGIAGGYFIQELINKLKDTNYKIIAIEYFEEDIFFLQKLPLIQQLNKNKNLKQIPYSKIYETILNEYIPSFYGNLEIIEQKVWGLENSDLSNEIKKRINDSIQAISRDYSVQSHFGKIWAKNIMSNISKLNDIKPLEINLKNKKTYIIAAGPSLDLSINILKKDKDEHYIISTDTAFSTLVKQDIIPNIVISIDAQNISHKHFMCSKKIDFSKILFVFDLSSNSSQIDYIKSKNGNIFFITTGHPLSLYFSKITNKKLLNLNAGSGTVTISALDLAIKAGSKDIYILGADFCYKNAKPYTKGTYLDSIYFDMNNKITNIEKSYTSLIFRTETKKQNNNYYTDVLTSYKNSLEEFIQINNLQFSHNNDIYHIKNYNYNGENIYQKKVESDQIQKFFSFFINTSSKNKLSEKNFLFEQDICILPLISWIRKHDNNNVDFIELRKKAYKIIERYCK